MSAQPVVVLAVQDVPHAVPPPLQASPLLHAVAVGVVQAPVLSQVLAGVDMPPEQAAAAHAVAELQQSTLQTCGETHWLLPMHAIPTASWVTQALLPLQKSPVMQLPSPVQLVPQMVGVAVLHL